MQGKAGNTINIFTVLQAFLLFITLQFFVGPLLFLITYSFVEHVPLRDMKIDNPALVGWVSVVGILSTIIGMLLMFWMQERQTRRSVWFLEDQQPRLWYKDVLFGIGACILAYPFVIFFDALVTAILAYFGIEVKADQVAVKQVKHVLDNIPLLISLGICVTFFVPCVEELLFRGYLQQWIKKYLPVPSAILFTSLAFASVHFAVDQGMANIPLLSALFLLSCVLGYIRELRGSLWATIGLHSFFNALGILFIVASA